MSITFHTDDCVHESNYVGADCAPVGVWNQPPLWAVEEAESELDTGELDSVSWCVIRQRAWELVALDG